MAYGVVEYWSDELLEIAKHKRTTIDTHVKSPFYMDLGIQELRII